MLLVLLYVHRDCDVKREQRYHELRQTALAMFTRVMLINDRWNQEIGSLMHLP
jgi:hypothetical protein